MPQRQVDTHKHVKAIDPTPPFRADKAFACMSNIEQVLQCQSTSEGTVMSTFFTITPSVQSTLRGVLGKILWVAKHLTLFYSL